MPSRNSTGIWVYLLAACVSLAILISVALKHYPQFISQQIQQDKSASGSAANNPGTDAVLDSGAAQSQAFIAESNTNTVADKTDSKNPSAANDNSQASVQSAASSSGSSSGENSDGPFVESSSDNSKSSVAGADVEANSREPVRLKLIDANSRLSSANELASKRKPGNQELALDDAVSLPATEFDIEIGLGVARLTGVLADTPLNRRWSRLFGSKQNLRVLDNLEFVPAVSGAQADFPESLLEALQAVDTTYSELRISLRDGAFKLAGFVSTAGEFSTLRAALSRAEDERFLNGFSVTVSPLKPAYLEFTIANGVVQLEGLVAQSQLTELRRQFASTENYSASLGSAERVQKINYIDRLQKLLAISVDSLAKARIEIGATSVFAEGQLVSGEVESVVRLLAAQLPATVALQTELRPAPLARVPPAAVLLASAPITNDESAKPPPSSAANSPITASEALSEVPQAEAIVVTPKDPAEIEKLEQIKALLEDMLSVQFGELDSQPNTATIAVLDRLFETLFLYSNLRVSLRVHSDDTSKSVDNLLLSRSRANNMANYLHERGLEKYRLSAVGVGDTRVEQVIALRSGRSSLGTLVELRFTGN